MFFIAIVLMEASMGDHIIPIFGLLTLGQSVNLLVMPDGSIIFLLFSRSDEIFYLIKTDMQEMW